MWSVSNYWALVKGVSAWVTVKFVGGGKIVGIGRGRER